MSSLIPMYDIDNNQLGESDDEDVIHDSTQSYRIQSRGLKYLKKKFTDFHISQEISKISKTCPSFFQPLQKPSYSRMRTGL